MKKRAFVAIAAVLILAVTAVWYFTPKTFAKGVKADEVACFRASEWSGFPAEAEMETVCPSYAPEYPGVYRHAWREEIAGTVVEMNSYIVLNEDGTGCWIAQDVGMLTWEDGQLTLTVGAAYDMVLAQEGETVNLLVSDGGEAPTVFEKIDELPAQIQSLLVRVNGDGSR